MSNQLIQFLSQQIISDKQNLENFNSIGKIQLKVEDNKLLFWTTEHKKVMSKSGGLLIR